jgi:rubrerythrin
MLDLENLSAEELTLIGREAAEECGSRFREIAEASDPCDTALRELLGSMATEVLAQVQSEHGDPFGASCRRTAEGVREFIRASLPTLTKRFGEGVLHRDIALFYAESLEEEASRFYRMLAAHARESRARKVFEELSDRERVKLRFLREVVLQG